MYKYLLFRGFNYYPSGGIDDLGYKCNSYEELVENYEYETADWYQLVNTNDFDCKRLYREDFETRDEFYSWLKEQMKSR